MTQQDKELRKAGLKVTLPRVKILELLEEAHGANRHMSAEDVFRQLRDAGEDIGLATVYRVLTQFQDAGLVIKHNFDNDQAVFELESGMHHDHMVCLRCNKVIEFSDETIEQRQKAIADRHGFRLTHHSLTMHGICAECLKKTPG
ncbi:MAG: ferric iron uptake transcriptional regulator [Pseudomonadota bacterium]